MDRASFAVPAALGPEARGGGAGPTLWAVSDLHAVVRANASHIDSIRPSHPGDWLIVAGDVAEKPDKIIQVLGQLVARFATVIWVPGNHELFCSANDTYQGKEKYAYLVQRCREIGVLTPEDPFPSFAGVTIVPLFTLYDYSFRPPGWTVDQALAAAHERQAVLTDQLMIAPFVNILEWCWDRLTYSIKRLSKVDGPMVLVNHWPLVVEPVQHLRIPEIGLWCGTTHTRAWAQRYDVRAVVYGHLHMPGTFVVDGVPHHEVSLGYPREWGRYGQARPWPVPILGPQGEALEPYGPVGPQGRTEYLQLQGDGDGS